MTINPCKLARMRELLDAGEDKEIVAKRFGISTDNLRMTMLYHERHRPQPAPRKREKLVGERIRERAQKARPPKAKP